MSILIYTDGACSGNPGPGGWAAHIQYPDGTVQELGGHVPETTNNRMELMAVIQAIKEIRSEQQALTILTDSQYVKNGITTWIHTWKAKRWMTSKKTPVLNADLWRKLDVLNHAGITWKHIPAHVGNHANERCDEIARRFSKQKNYKL